MVYVRNTKIGENSVNNIVLSNQDADISLREKALKMRQNNSSALYIAEQKDDDLSFSQIQEAADLFRNVNGQAEEQNLAKVLEENNLLLYCYEYSEVSRDKNDVARMAFNGHVDRPNEYEISPLLRDLKNLRAQRATTTPLDYDLSHSTAWQVFKQVPEFEQIEDKVKKALSMYGVSPKDLPKLNLKDFCFLINDQFRSGSRDSAKVFNESYKARNTKRFIAENEADFRTGLLSMKGVDKEYVEVLISAMKRGITDLSKLKDRQGNSVLKPEWEKTQPVIDVHHILNVKDSGTKEKNGQSFASVNDYKNMCFIVRYPHHDALHALENDLNGNYRNDVFYNRKIDKKFIYRIQPPEGVRSIIGFNAMIYDRDETTSKIKEQQSQAQESRNSQWGSDKEAKLDAVRKESRYK